jgi:hypothetical protein
MRDFLNAGKLLLLDLASTILFVGVFLLTHNTFLSIGLGMTPGLGQIGIQLVRQKPIDMMEWLNFFLVICCGGCDAALGRPALPAAYFRRYICGRRCRQSDVSARGSSMLIHLFRARASIRWGWRRFYSASRELDTRKGHNATEPNNAWPQKITFADMRDMGVRSLLILLLGLQVQPPGHHERRSVA